METAVRCVERVRGVVLSLRAGSRTDPAWLDDLVGEGLVGLAEADARFDPEKAHHFWTYAFWKVKGRVLDSLRRRGTMGRGIVAIRESELGGRTLTARGRPGLDAVSAGHRSMESQLTQRSVTRLMGDLLAALEPDERHIVCECLMLQRTVAAVSREMRVHPRRVARVLARCTRELKRALLRKGFRLEDFV
jgi:RNA polymerase sigma factor (sigma-70 family)